MFRKLLIANRGEIALRIMRTCREMGIRTVAVYSDADRQAAYVAEADEAHPLGPPPPAQSYLRIDRLIEIARTSRSEAIHPGYGFLAENADFAEACEKAKIRFIGPPASSIRLIGNKIAARTLAEKNDIPVVPGITRPINEADAETFAKKEDFPILLKAAAGGGGRGMRVVRSSKELGRAFREASAEAKSAFGDETLFVEKYVERPRHIEIQLLADGRGQVIHLGERECSIQRRHQKLVEESPSVAVDDDLRRRMGEIACRLAARAGYQGAGTAEFLLDKNGRFYFLEVNTRLQVEHPVTEMITGLDLVREQILIASGKPLSLTQEQVVRRGHAIECRICAEDPYSGFAPTTGEIVDLRLPAGPFVRVDTGLVPGMRVSVYYDSLLAKLIVWGPDRPTALARMERALREFTIVGPQTTIPLHLQLLSNARFRKGEIHTKFLEQEFELSHKSESDSLEAALIAAALEHIRRERTTPKYASPRPLSAWKLAEPE